MDMADTQTIALDDIPVTLSLGVPAAERDAPQTVLVSLALTMGLRPSPSSDRLADTVDYAAIIAFLQADLPALGPFHLVETVAECVAAYVLALTSRIDDVTVSVKKPSVLAAPAIVSVSITRHADSTLRRQGLSVAEGGR
jgi:FolB domain-containing protein